MREGYGRSLGSMSDVVAPTPYGSTPRPGERKIVTLMRRRASWVVFAFPAILALSLIANGARQASERGDASIKAKRDLTEAFTAIPFKIRLPKALPSTVPMVRVVLDKPDSKQGFQAYQLNVWYTVRGSVKKGDKAGESVHVWQTNDKFLARRLRDPLQLVGVEEKIGGETWRRVVDDRVPGRVVTTFSKRFDDGITMTIDSSTPDLARTAIAGLGTANG
jgi:hypothetical protein